MHRAAATTHRARAARAVRAAGRYRVPISAQTAAGRAGLATTQACVLNRHATAAPRRVRARQTTPRTVHGMALLSAITDPAQRPIQDAQHATPLPSCAMPRTLTVPMSLGPALIQPSACPTHAAHASPCIRAKQREARVPGTRSTASARWLQREAVATGNCPNGRIIS